MQITLYYLLCSTEFCCGNASLSRGHHHPRYIKGKKSPCLGVVVVFVGMVWLQYESLARFIARLRSCSLMVLFLHEACRQRDP